MQEFKYNVFGNIRPSKVKTSISDDVDNPYLGKFIKRRAVKPNGVYTVG